MDISSIRKTWQALYDGVRGPTDDELLIQDLIRENQELAQRNTDLRMINEGLKKALALAYSRRTSESSENGEGRTDTPEPDFGGARRM